MLILASGRERTAAEFTRLLTTAGFELRRIISAGGPLAIDMIEAKLLDP